MNSIKSKKAPHPPLKIQVNSVVGKSKLSETRRPSSMEGDSESGGDMTRREGSVRSVKKTRAPEIPSPGAPIME